MIEYYICKECGQSTEHDTSLIAKEFKIPFTCPECNQIHFKYQALRHLVFIFPEKIEQKIGSFYIPDKVWDNYQYEYGIVLSAGKGYYTKKRKWINNPYKPGDYVVFDRFVPWKFKAEDTEIKIMSMEDVKAFINLNQG